MKLSTRIQNGVSKKIPPQTGWAFLIALIAVLIVSLGGLTYQRFAETLKTRQNAELAAIAEFLSLIHI